MVVICSMHRQSTLLRLPINRNMVHTSRVSTSALLQLLAHREFNHKAPLQHSLWSKVGKDFLVAKHQEWQVSAEVGEIQNSPWGLGLLMDDAL